MGIGHSIHAGMVVVADGTEAAAERLERVLTTDPGMGVVRHLDAGYERRESARARARPCRRRCSTRPCLAVVAAAARSRSRAAGHARGPAGARCAGAALGGGRGASRTPTSSARRDRSRRSGGCATCGALDGDVEELDGRGLCAVPGLVDCHTHPAWGGDRVEEFSLRAGGASYEELHAAGGGILSTVRATRALGADGLRERVARHAPGCSRHGTTTWEGKSGYGLDRETELASLRAVAAAGGSPTWLGAHAVPPEHDDADAYLDFALAEVLPEAAELADAADVFLERGAFDAAQARRYLRPAVTPGLRCDCTATSSPRAGAIPLAIELGARSVDHLEATGAAGVASSRQATS